jgi:hypothetical protein
MRHCSTSSVQAGSAPTPLGTDDKARFLGDHRRDCSVETLEPTDPRKHCRSPVHL